MMASGRAVAAIATAALLLCARWPGALAQTEPSAMQISSTAFGDGQPMPQVYTGDGEDVSPPLAWKGVPAGARQLAMIVDDPDAPRAEPWVHWVIYGMAAEVGGLPQGVPRGGEVKAPAAMQGRNSWEAGEPGYRGPSPPPGHGMHHYRFTLYALDEALALKPGLTKQELRAAMQGHVLGTAVLVGTYERPKK